MAATTTGAQASTESAGSTGTGTPPAAGAAGTPDAAAAAAGQTTDTGRETPGDTAAATTSAKAPAQYTLTVPEGGAEYLTPEDLAEVETIARANDWTNEDAQAEVTHAVERAQAREQARAAALRTELEADPDYGGAKLADTQRLAKAAIDAVFPQGHRLRAEFDQLLARPGVGNNVRVVGFLAELGRQLGEDRLGVPRGGPPGPEARRPEEVLYDHPTSRAAG